MQTNIFTSEEASHIDWEYFRETQIKVCDRMKHPETMIAQYNYPIILVIPGRKRSFGYGFIIYYKSTDKGHKLGEIWRKGNSKTGKMFDVVLYPVAMKLLAERISSEDYRILSKERKTPRGGENDVYVMTENECCRLFNTAFAE